MMADTPIELNTGKNITLRKEIDSTAYLSTNLEMYHRRDTLIPLESPFLKERHSFSMMQCDWTSVNKPAAAHTPLISSSISSWAHEQTCIHTHTHTHTHTQYQRLLLEHLSLCPHRRSIREEIRIRLYFRFDLHHFLIVKLFSTEWAPT